MSEHRGVSAAEKYAELEKAGASRPRCSCHEEVMKWHRDTRLPAGGSWLCFEKVREDSRRWNKANPEKARESGRRWRKANPGRRSEWASRRRRKGIPLDAPMMAQPESGRRGRRIQLLRKAVADKHAMNIIERLDPRQAKLMRLSVDEGASPYERRRALEKLDQHMVTKPKESGSAWQHSKITSEGTHTPLPLPRSTYC